MFFLCTYCDRGQVYCSPGCRETARRLQLRAANLRHQQSEEGRLDHRDRQRAYRRRLTGSATTSAAQNVTDHGSNDHSSHDIVGAAPSNDSELIDLDASLIQPTPPRGDLRLHRSGIVCRCCGRSGLFINPFNDLE
jgi:hypothetical protein